MQAGADTRHGVTQQDWLEDLHPSEWGAGFYLKQPNHAIVMVQRPAEYLLVTFDHQGYRHLPDHSRVPWGAQYAKSRRISHLSVMSNVSNWFQDDWLVKQFRRFSNQGHFDGYKRVLFAGLGMGAFGAVSFSRYAKHAHVAAFAPQSTLDPELLDWDDRFPSGNRQDWSHEVSDAGKARPHRMTVFVDPRSQLDVQHIERLKAQDLRVFHTMHSNQRPFLYLNRLGIAERLMDRLIKTDLTALEYYRLLRDRRYLQWTRNNLRRYHGDKSRQWAVDIVNRYEETLKEHARMETLQTTATEAF